MAAQAGVSRLPPFRGEKRYRVVSRAADRNAEGLVCSIMTLHRGPGDKSLLPLAIEPCRGVELEGCLVLPPG